MDYTFKTQPFPHQLSDFGKSRDLEFFGILWEQGTGKTKLAIDTAAWLFRHGKIDRLLVLAPNGVHQNWFTDELPLHCPIPFTCHAWQSKKAGTKTHQREFSDMLSSSGLKVLALSYDGIMTDRGSAAAKKFLDSGLTLYIADESQRIKTPSAKRTIRAIASAKYAQYRRILSGTPVPNKPFDIYSQLKFLRHDIWVQEGFASYEAFKTFFGNWEQRLNGQTGQRFQSLVSYRNLDILHKIIDKYCSRVLKADVLDLPPKLYTKQYFEISPEQRKYYDQIRRDFIAEIEGGATSTAPLEITRLLRLQQIACDYLPVDDGEPYHIFKEEPRLKALKEVLEDIEDSVIIWARFQRDIDRIKEALGDQCVVYDGRTSPEDRDLAKARFQRGEVPYFLGNPAACGTGHTLHRAKTAIYYSNSFNFGHRLQSEDRNHRIGTQDRVLYIDLIAKGTVDEKIIWALRNKLNIASEVIGDKIKEWI